MALDPNIPLSMPKQPSPMEQMGQAYDLAGAMEKQKSMQEQRQDSANLQQYLKEGGNLDTPEGLTKAAEWAKGTLSPGGYQTIIKAGQEKEVNRLKQVEALAKLDEIKFGNMLKTTEILTNTIGPLLTEHDQRAGATGEAGVGKQQAAEEFKTKLQPVLQNLVQNKVITPEQAAQHANDTPEQARRVLESTTSGQKMLQDAETLRKTRAEASQKELGDEAIRQNLVKQFGETSPQVKRFDNMQSAKLAHEQRLAKGVGLGGVGGSTGLPAKGWKFVQSSEGIYRANPNAGIVQKQDEETGEWSQVLESAMPVEVVEKLGGAKGVSAITDRLNRRTMTAAGEVSRALNMVAMMPVGQSEGIFNYDKPSGITTAIKREMTSQEAIDYNAATSAMALELTTLLRGGMQLNEAEIKEVKEGLTVQPGMNIGNARFRFANTVSKVLTALENFEPTSSQQADQKEKYIKELSKYPSPEQVYQENRTGQVKKQTMAESLAKTKAKAKAEPKEDFAAMLKSLGVKK